MSKVLKQFGNRNAANVSAAEVREHVAMLTIFFKSLKYTLVNEVPYMTFIDLVSIDYT
jgi:hypothetical protein